MVSTRLFLAGVVSPTRDRRLADRLLLQVHDCTQRLGALLVCTDVSPRIFKNVLLSEPDAPTSAIDQLDTISRSVT